jgi:hypothetical protein
MSDAVDVAVETFEGELYQFPNTSEASLRQALAKALGDQTVLSLVNLSGAAMVVLWPTVCRITFANIDADVVDDVWQTLWEVTP